MTDLQVLFQKIIDNHIDTLTDKKRFRGILNDVFPKNKKEVAAFIYAYESKIHIELSNMSEPDAFFERNFIDKLINNYATSRELAEFSVKTWITCFVGKKLPELKPIIDKAPEIQPKIDPLINKETKPKKTLSKRIENYFTCGVGRQDFGFIVLGIKKSNYCSNAMANIYAVVFAYLQRTLNAKPGKYIENCEKETHFSVNYSNVFRLQVIILLLIKNNYCNDNLLGVSYDDDKTELEFAIGNINYYAGIFCELAGIPYRDIVLIVSKRSQCHVSLSEQSDCISIKNCTTRETTCRAMWYAKNIRYDISEKNIDILTMLLDEVFGYKKFNDGQFEALQELLNNDDRHSICIMPTGAGKSLIFYFIALLKSCPTFVICPTDILISDQLINLHKQHNFDDAFHLKSNEDYSDFIPENKLIYLTPLTFLHHQLIRKLILLNHQEYMGNVILDEVHCISNWSHDFRPEYLMLSFNLREFVDKTGYKCFTATANYTVVRDIQTQLGVNPNDIISPISFRKNKYNFDFIECGSQNEMRSTAANKIIEFLKSAKYNNRKALVFTKNEGASRELRDEISDEFRDYVDIYHSDNERSYIDFAEGKYNVLIADLDLGIGVNLPNVTDTIHLGLPISKSQFVQEFGRAGRNHDNSNSTVTFLDKDAYTKEERILLFRNTPIEEIITLSANKTEYNDTIEAFEKIFGGIEDQTSYYNGIIKVYESVKSNKEGREVKFLTNPKEPFDKQVSRLMRYLYVLYRIGFIFGWYVVNTDKDDNSVEFFIDPKGRNEDNHDIEAINEITANYLHNMGGYKKNISAIKNSKTIEETIKHFVEWHYHQFLYHHREQLLEMLDFLDAYKNKDEKMVLEALDNYFSLSLVAVQQDSNKANMLTIKDITSMIVRGVDGGMIDNIRKSNENEYSAKLDYFLFGYNLFALNNTDMSRLERIISSFSEIEFNELLEQINVFYKASDIENKLLMLNALCKRTTLKNVIDSLYSKIEKDIVFCWIMSACANNKMGV